MENKIEKLKESEMQKLISELGSDDGLIRQNARHKLAKMGKDSLDVLAELLIHPKHVYRWEAAKILEEIGDPISIPLLLQALEDDKVDIRWIAAKGLIKIGTVSIVPLLKALEEKSDSVFLLEGAHHVFFELREMNKLPTGFQVNELLSSLKNIGWKESIKPLVYELLAKLKN